MLKRLFSSATRRRRSERWNRAIRSDRQRLRAWINMIFVDHGFFRLAYLNLHRVTPDFWRAAQPAPTMTGVWRRTG
jgi:hypothetical protein